jgi:hypothetical protein
MKSRLTSTHDAPRATFSESGTRLRRVMNGLRRCRAASVRLCIKVHADARAVLAGPGSMLSSRTDKSFESLKPRAISAPNQVFPSESQSQLADQWYPRGSLFFLERS